MPNAQCQKSSVSSPTTAKKSNALGAIARSAVPLAIALDLDSAIHSLQLFNFLRNSNRMKCRNYGKKKDLQIKSIKLANQRHKTGKSKEFQNGFSQLIKTIEN